ncbi:MAG: Pvc16 family protein [Cyanobacteria bacterium P01_F01_bin.56]
MIPAVSQTLARILASQTSLETVQQVSFDRPQRYQAQPVGVNLYAYDVRQAGAGLADAESGSAIANWATVPERAGQVEISFLVVARDWTRLGEQQLLAEAITYFAQHSEIPADRLVPALQGYGSIAIEIARPIDIVALWRALEVPLQPALYLKVTVPTGELTEDSSPASLQT